MNFFKQTKLFLLFGLLLSLASCHDTPVNAPLAKDYDGEVIARWNMIFSDIEHHAAGYRPCAAPRALAYLGLSAYHAILPGMPDYNSLETSLPGSLEIPEIDNSKSYHWPSVVNGSYAYMMKKFFYTMASGPYSNLYDKIDLTRAEWVKNALKSGVSQEEIDRSLEHGEAVAKVVYEWSKTDGSHDAFLNPQPSDYVPPVFPGSWQPTYPNFGKGMYPYFGTQTRPMAMSQNELLCPSPIQFSENPGSKFYGQAEYVKQVVDNIKNPGPTQADKDEAYVDLWIAEFWSDDVLHQTFSPPTRWVVVPSEVVLKDHIDLEKSTELYAKIGVAMMDYAIACWKSKYHYNIERPVSYIRRVMDPNWVTALNDATNPGGAQGMTPSFPAYPSGHSGFGAAAAACLTDVIGDYYAMIDESHKVRVEFNGKPRFFNSFDEMAWENAISRVALGVHFYMDCEAGYFLGQKAASRCLQLPWKN